MRRKETGKTISIHALREEGDPQYLQTSSATFVFLSTPSARRATAVSRMPSPYRRISIHALREEGDFGPFDGSKTCDISIHALREEGDSPASASTRGRVCYNQRPLASWERL